MRSLWLFPVLLCGCGATTAKDISTIRPPGTTELGQIFTERRARSLCEGLVRPEPTGYWTPEQDQVEALEAALEGYLASTEPLEGGLEGYRAQYVGILRGDRELILANIFCRELGVDIDDRLVTPQDGDRCVRTLEYNPVLGSFENLPSRDDD